jgi:hypothetical protein
MADWIRRAQYLSQKQKTASRKRLNAAKLRLNLGGLARHSRTNVIKAQNVSTYSQRGPNLETKANQTRFRKQIDIRTFAYHV